jgi:hypothetical protein
MRKTIWKQKVSKQATRVLFLAKYLLRNASEENSGTELTSKLVNLDENSSNSNDSEN